MEQRGGIDNSHDQRDESAGITLWDEFASVSGSDQPDARQPSVIEAWETVIYRRNYSRRAAGLRLFRSQSWIAITISNLLIHGSFRSITMSASSSMKYILQCDFPAGKNTLEIKCANHEERSYTTAVQHGSSKLLSIRGNVLCLLAICQQEQSV